LWERAEGAQIHRMHSELFDETILPHLDAAHNLARWLVPDRDDAEDVVQEACLRAFRYFGSFRGVNPRAWLLSIVRTTAFKWLEKGGAQHLTTEFHEEMHGDGPQAFDPEAALLRRADTQLLEETMHRLPNRLREVLVLRELEGLSYKEIAEVVGIPTGTVMSTLFRAREGFRQAASELVKRRARAKGSSDLSQAELAELAPCRPE
jgi:RNA polymerase sigma-70 factor (ECF subfamily)